MIAQIAIPLSLLEKTIIDFTNALYQDNCIDLISKEQMRDALSSGQLMSKAWLLDKFAYVAQSFVRGEDIPTIVCGGWIGFIAQALNTKYLRVYADSLDLDPNAAKIAHHVLGGSGESIIGDMYGFDYAPYRCVINTSAEHIPDVSAWSDSIQAGTRVVVQSNNARHIAEHISCVDSAEELAEKLKLSEVYFQGDLEFPMYTRFMVIGQK